MRFPNVRIEQIVSPLHATRKKLIVYLFKLDYHQCIAVIDETDGHVTKTVKEPHKAAILVAASTTDGSLTGEG